MNVNEIADITTSNTIKGLKEYFRTKASPPKLMMDNGPTLKSKPFQQFVERNVVIHITLLPYRSLSNRATENVLKSFKEKFKVLLKEYESEDYALFKYLFYCRSTPHCITGVFVCKTFLYLIRCAVAKLDRKG